MSTLPTDLEGEYRARFLDGVSEGVGETAGRQTEITQRHATLPSLSPRLSPFLPFLNPGPEPLATMGPGFRAPALGSLRAVQEAKGGSVRVKKELEVEE